MQISRCSCKFGDFWCSFGGKNSQFLHPWFKSRLGNTVLSPQIDEVPSSCAHVRFLAVWVCLSAIRVPASLSRTPPSSNCVPALSPAEHVSVEAGCEGYIAGQLTTGGRERQAQTSVCHLTAHVEWGEELVFPLPHGYQVEGEVSLSLHSCDRFSRNTNLGAMRFKLADVAMMSNADCWVDLQPPKQVHELVSPGGLP